MDTQGTGYNHNRETHHSSLNPKVKHLAQESPQPQIAGRPEAKSGLESLELALFLFSFLRICYWPLSLLDSVRKDGSEPEKQRRAFLGREPNTQAGGGANAGWLCPARQPKTTLKSPGPSCFSHLWLPTQAPWPGLGSCGEPAKAKHKPRSQQEGLATTEEFLTKPSPAVCVSKVMPAPWNGRR